MPRLTKLTFYGIIYKISEWGFNMEEIRLNQNDLCKDDKDIKVKNAKEFSEGSKALEEFLLYLWDNNINTFGCCKGHEYYIDSNGKKKPGNNPYVFLDYKNIDDICFGYLWTLFSTKTRNIFILCK